MAKLIGICLILTLINLPNIVHSQYWDYGDFTLEMYGCKGLYKFKYNVSQVIFTFPDSTRFYIFTPNDGFPVIITNPANKTVPMSIAITNSTGNFNLKAFQISAETCCNDSVSRSGNCYDLTLSCSGGCNVRSWPEYTDFYRSPVLKKCSVQYCYVGETTGQKQIIVPINSQNHLFNISIGTIQRNISEIIWRKGISKTIYSLPPNTLVFSFRKDDLFQKYFVINRLENEIEIKVKDDLSPNGRASIYIKQTSGERLLYFIWYSPLICTVFSPLTKYLNVPLINVNCNNPIQKQISYEVNNTEYQMIENNMHFKDLTVNGIQRVAISAMYTGLPDSAYKFQIVFNVTVIFPLVNVTGCKAVVNLTLLNYTKISFTNERLGLSKTLDKKVPVYVITVLPNTMNTILVNFNDKKIPYLLKATSSGMCCMDEITPVDTPFCVDVILKCPTLCDKSSWPEYENFIKPRNCTGCGCTFCYIGANSGVHKLYRQLDSSTHLVQVNIPSFTDKVKSVIGLVNIFVKPVLFSNYTISKMISSPIHSNFEDYFITSRKPNFNTFQIKPDTKFPLYGRVILYVYSQLVFNAVETGFFKETINIAWYSPLRCIAIALNVQFLNDPLVEINCTNPIQLPIAYKTFGEKFQIKGNLVYLKNFTVPIPNQVLYTAMYESYMDSGTDLTGVSLKKDFTNDPFLTVYGCKAEFHIGRLNYTKLNILSSDLQLNITLTDKQSFFLIDILQTTTFDLYVNDENTSYTVKASPSGVCCNETVAQANNSYVLHLGCPGNCEDAVWEEYQDFYQTSKCGNCSCQYSYIGNVSRSYIFFVNIKSAIHPIEVNATAVEKTTFEFIRPRREFFAPILLPASSFLRPLPDPKDLPFDYVANVFNENKTYVKLTLKKDAILSQYGRAQIYFQPIQFERNAMKVHEYNIIWFPAIECNFTELKPNYRNDPFLLFKCNGQLQRDIVYSLSHNMHYFFANSRELCHMLENKMTQYFTVLDQSFNSKELMSDIPYTLGIMLHPSAVGIKTNMQISESFIVCPASFAGRELAQEQFQIRNDFVYLKDLTASGFYNVSFTAMYKGLPHSDTVFSIFLKLEAVFPQNAIVSVLGCTVNFNFTSLRYEGLNLYSQIGINETVFKRNYSTTIPAGQTTTFKLQIDAKYSYNLKATSAKFCCHGNITHDLSIGCYTIDMSCRDLCNRNFPDTRNFYVTTITSKCSAIYCYRGGLGGDFNMTVPLKNYQYEYTVKMYPTNRTTEIVQFLIGTKQVWVPFMVFGPHKIQPYTYSSYINITIDNNEILFKEIDVKMPEGHFNVSISFINIEILQDFPYQLQRIHELSVYVFKRVNCTLRMLPYVKQFPTPVCELQCSKSFNMSLKYDLGIYSTWLKFKQSVLYIIRPGQQNITVTVSVSYAVLNQSASYYEVIIPTKNYSMSVKLKKGVAALFDKLQVYISTMAKIIRYEKRAGNQIDVVLQTNSAEGLVTLLKERYPQKQVEILRYFIPDGKLKITGLNGYGDSGNRYVFTCYTDSTFEDVIYEWYWNDARVSGESSSMVDGKSQGSVVFDMLNEKDSGNVTCHVRRESYVPDTRKIYITMWDFPKVQLNATSQIIKNQNPVNVSCYVLPLNKLQYPVFKVNGKLVKTNMVSLAKEANVSCYAVTRFRGEIKTLNISIAIGKKLCPTETSYNVQWPETVARSTAKVTCKGDFSGTASRLCLTDGTWELPTIECVKKAIDDARLTLSRIELGLGGDFETTVESLANATKESLNAEDIDETISAVDTVSSITNTSEAVSNKNVKNVVDVISNLLAEDTKPAWVKLEKKKKITAATVMKQMDDFGKVASKFLNETTTISTDNLVIELSKVDASENFNFPSAEANQSQWVKESDSNVFLPSGILKDNFGVNETVIVNAVLFRNMKELLPEYENSSSIVNSFVLSISLQKPLENLTEKVLLNFSHVSSGYSESSCNFWDFNINPEGGGYWSTRGCEVVNSGSNYTVCGCDHLTNFAILMNPVSHKSREILNIITIVGCSISIISLVVTVIVYAIFWKHVTSEDVSKSQSILLMNLCVSLIVAYVIFVAFVEGPREKSVCTAIAALIQYFFLVVFFTMFAEGIDMAIALTVVFTAKFRRLPWLLLFSWVGPAVIVGISLGSTMTKGFGNEQFCWLTPEDNAIWSFIAPAVIIIMANIVCVIFIVKALLSSYCMLRKSVKERLRTGARAIGILTPLLGFTWLFGVLAVNEDLVAFEYIFTISSSLQGLFIFITYCVFNKQIQKNICKKEKLGKQVPSKPTQSTSNSENTRETDLTSSARRSEYIDDSMRSTEEIVVKNSIYDPHVKNREQRLSTDNGLRKSIKPYYSNPQTALYSERL